MSASTCAAGRRRCWPCTLLNETVLACATVWIARRGRRAIAIAVVAAGTVAIGLRGYLVPYTPRGSPRHCPAPPSATRPPRGEIDSDSAGAGGSRPDPSVAPEAPRSLTGNAPASDDVLATLLDAGVLVADEGSLVLSENAKARWRSEMDALRARARPSGRDARGGRRSLRRFLDACPAYGGPIAETTTAACCEGGVLFDGPEEVLACESCDRRLFTFRS